MIKFADMELQKAKENMKAGKCSWVYRMLLELLEPQRLPVEWKVANTKKINRKVQKHLGVLNALSKLPQIMIRQILEDEIERKVELAKYYLQLVWVQKETINPTGNDGNKRRIQYMQKKG